LDIVPIKNEKRDVVLFLASHKDITSTKMAEMQGGSSVPGLMPGKKAAKSLLGSKVALSTTSEEKERDKRLCGVKCKVTPGQAYFPHSLHARPIFSL